jgi:hypothetical protein
MVSAQYYKRACKAKLPLLVKLEYNETVPPPDWSSPLVSLPSVIRGRLSATLFTINQQIFKPRSLTGR